MRSLPPDRKVQRTCPLQMQLDLQIFQAYPSVFSQLKGYDSHLLMQDLGKYKEKKLSCIAKNTEKYISFQLGDLQFLDSLNFMNESLGKLVNNLAAEGDDNFHHVKRHTKEHCC